MAVDTEEREEAEAPDAPSTGHTEDSHNPANRFYGGKPPSSEGGGIAAATSVIPGGGGSSGGGDGGGAAGGLFNKGEDGKTGGGGILATLKKHKKLLAGGGGIALLGAILVIFILLGSLIIPNFENHMLAYSFVDVTRDSADSVAEVDAQESVIDSANATGYKAFINDFSESIKAAVPDSVGDFITKFNTYRPNKVFQNLKLNGDIVYNYAEKPLVSIDLGTGKAYTLQQLESITVNGETFQTPNKLANIKSLASNPLDYLKDAYSQKKGLRAVLTTEGSSSFGGKILQWFVRGKVMDNIEESIDAQRYRWTTTDLSEDENATRTKAEALDTTISYDAATNNGTSIEAAVADAPDEVKSATGNAAAAEQQCASNPTCIASGQLHNKVLNILNNAFSDTFIKKALSLFSATYAIFVPLCLMFQSSVQNSGQTITTSTQNAERAAVTFNAGANQIQTGQVNGKNVVNGTAVGGLADHLEAGSGDNALQNSVPEARAAGRSYDTSSYSSLEAGGAGSERSYTDIFNTFLPTAAANVFSPIANGVCAVFTNVWSGVALGIVQLGASIFPGLGQVADTSGQVTAKALAAVVVKNLGSTARNFMSKSELLKLGAISGVTIIGSIFAKAISWHTAGIDSDGAGQGADYANLVDQGNILLAGDEDRGQNYAVPLTGSQIQQLEVSDDSQVASMTPKTSVTQRYFALSNPNSLLNNLAVSFELHVRSTSITSILSSAASLFNPIHAMSQLASIIHPATVSAAAPYNAVAQNYGLIKFGWPVDQETAYLDDSTYGVLNNQQILDASGMSSKIAAQFGTCFTEDVGTMLSSGDVQLDNNTGDVIANAGNCSPNNLGMDNCNFSYKGACDMVFRWRISMRDMNTLTQVIDTQNVKPSATAGT